MGLMKRLMAAGTEVKPSKNYLIRWDCPHCEHLFKTPEAAEKHIKNEHSGG